MLAVRASCRVMAVKSLELGSIGSLNVRRIAPKFKSNANSFRIGPEVSSMKSLALARIGCSWFSAISRKLP